MNTAANAIVGFSESSSTWALVKRDQVKICAAAIATSVTSPAHKVPARANISTTKMPAIAMNTSTAGRLDAGRSAACSRMFSAASARTLATLCGPSGVCTMSSGRGDEDDGIFQNIPPQLPPASKAAAEICRSARGPEK